MCLSVCFLGFFFSFSFVCLFSKEIMKESVNSESEGGVKDLGEDEGWQTVIRTECMKKVSLLLRS